MKFYEIKAQNDNATISIFGPVGDDLFSAVNSEGIVSELKELKDAKRIQVDINSPGGSVFEGNAIYAALKAHPAHITVHITGLAASIASVIAMAGDTITMAENALMMIHKPWGNFTGNADELRNKAETLDKVEKTIISAYRRTGKTESDIQQLMADETWFSADEALTHGFIDEVTDRMDIAASFDLSVFKNAPQKENEMKAENEILQKEVTRRQNISAIFAAHTGFDTLREKCKDDVAVTVEAAKTLLLNELGKGATPLAQDLDISGIISSGRDNRVEFKAAATDALLMREGIVVKEAHPGAADLKRISLISAAETMLQQAGQRITGMNAPAIMDAAMHSTSDFPSLLANVAGKSLLRAYDEEPGSHRIWTGTEQVADFKLQARDRLSEAPNLDVVYEGGEYKYGSFGESKESYQLLTYGKLFSITRQALINDDLSAFTRLPAAFGQSAVRKESDLVYAILTANPNMSDGVALFHANHSNLAGTGAALSVTTLGAARAAMRLQTGTQGIQALNITPTYLIVPAALETTAEQLIASLVDPAKSNDTANLNFIRSLTLVVDARLDADSTTAWYLAANYNQVETIVLGYLDGTRGVSYEEKPGWDIDGMEVKARLDTAAAALDWRGLYKNAGA